MPPASISLTKLCLGNALLALLIVSWVLQIWSADLRIPFAYEWRDFAKGGEQLDPIGSNDALLFYGLFKGIRENGWYLHNPKIGAPGSLDLQDYPMADSLHFSILKIIGWFTPNFGGMANLYFLLGFPLTAVTTLIFFRSQKISIPLSILGSQLFTFLPYHFLRGEQHLFLASYYLVPLMLLVIFWCLAPEKLVDFSDRQSIRQSISRRGWIAIGISVLTGCAGLYYALFGIFFLVIGTLVFQRNRNAILTTLLLSGIILGTMVINIIPSLIYILSNGANHQVANHLRADGELYGLKMIQMLLPVIHHRWEPFEAMAAYYFANAPLVTENVTASLGLISSAGFILLLVWQLGIRWPTERQSTWAQLGALNLAAFLLATIGGVSSVFCYALSPLVRCYNRMSVFIALFGLLAILLVLESAMKKWATTPVRMRMGMIGIAALLALGILDQTTPFFIPPYAQSKASFENDAELVGRIEAVVPPKSLILQLPYIPFPEGRPGGLSLMRPYLHSNHLQWSYGSMPGRPGDQWIRETLAAGNLNTVIQRLIQQGFSGIYIDRHLMPEAEKVEAELRKLDPSPIISQNQRQSFFRLGAAQSP